MITKIQKMDTVYKSLKESCLFDMDKIEIFYNSNEMLCIKDYSFKNFINGIAILNYIDYYKKIISIDILKPNYLIHETMVLKLYEN